MLRNSKEVRRTGSNDDLGALEEQSAESRHGSVTHSVEFPSVKTPTSERRMINKFSSLFDRSGKKKKKSMVDVSSPLVSSGSASSSPQSSSESLMPVAASNKAREGDHDDRKRRIEASPVPVVSIDEIASHDSQSPSLSPPPASSPKKVPLLNLTASPRASMEIIHPEKGETEGSPMTSPVGAPVSINGGSAPSSFSDDSMLSSLGASEETYESAVPHVARASSREDRKSRNFPLPFLDDISHFGKKKGPGATEMQPRSRSELSHEEACEMLATGDIDHSSKMGRIFKGNIAALPRLAERGFQRAGTNIAALPKNAGHSIQKAGNRIAALPKRAGEGMLQAGEEIIKGTRGLVDARSAGVVSAKDKLAMERTAEEERRLEALGLIRPQNAQPLSLKKLGMDLDMPRSPSLSALSPRSKRLARGQSALSSLESITPRQLSENGPASASPASVSSSKEKRNRRDLKMMKETLEGLEKNVHSGIGEQLDLLFADIDGQITSTEENLERFVQVQTMSLQSQNDEVLKGIQQLQRRIEETFHRMDSYGRRMKILEDRLITVQKRQAMQVSLVDLFFLILNWTILGFSFIVRGVLWVYSSIVDVISPSAQPRDRRASIAEPLQTLESLESTMKRQVRSAVETTGRLMTGTGSDSGEGAIDAELTESGGRESLLVSGERERTPSPVPSGAAVDDEAENDVKREVRSDEDGELFNPESICPENVMAALQATHDL